ncbi:MAG: M28 family peptidase [Candidatus Aenigmarchaeota archaeon]|nr:M28 family peptidase [Candidatus Aenigmarchaeota archaeon]
MTYIGTPGLKQDIFSILARLRGEKSPVYDYVLQLEKKADDLVEVKGRQFAGKLPEACTVQKLPSIAIAGTCDSEPALIFFKNNSIVLFGDSTGWSKGDPGFIQMMKNIADYFGGEIAVMWEDEKRTNPDKIGPIRQLVVDELSAKVFNHSKFIDEIDLSRFQQLWLIRPGWCDGLRVGDEYIGCNSSVIWRDAEFEVIESFVKKGGKVFIMTDAGGELKKESEFMPTRVVNSMLSRLKAPFKQGESVGCVKADIAFTSHGAVKDLERFEMWNAASFVCPEVPTQPREPEKPEPTQPGSTPEPTDTGEPPEPGSCSTAELVNAVSGDEMLRNMKVVTAAPHPMGTAKNRENADYEKKKLEEYGLKNVRFEDSGNLRNVVGEIGVGKGDVVVIGGHRDTVPPSPGAVDNEGTIAYEIGRVLAACDAKAKANIRIVGFDGEERGLLGSKAYVRAHPGETKRMMNFDCEGDRTASKADVYRTANDLGDAADKCCQQFNLPCRKGGPAGGNSDHASFGVPYTFIKVAAGGNGCGPNYHSSRDTYDGLGKEQLEWAAKLGVCIASELYLEH